MYAVVVLGRLFMVSVLFTFWVGTIASLAEEGKNLTSPKIRIPNVAAHYPTEQVAPPPTFEGKAVIRDQEGNYVLLKRSMVEVAQAHEPLLDVTASPLADIYIQDGSETALAVNYGDSNNLIAVYNTFWDFSPDIPISNSTNASGSWTSRTLPNGGGTFTGYPFDPWANPGNAAGEFFATEIRNDASATSNSHCIVSRSTDGGASFSLFFERSKAVFQDREMADVDKTTARGGGAGSTHDGKVYLCYDDWGAGFSGYVGSFLQVLSSVGASLTEIQVSGTGAPPFRGSQLQPVAGTTDGTVYVLGSAISGGGSTQFAYFHEITAGGAGPNTFLKSTLSWSPCGQQLGVSGRWGLNGHRLDNHGYLDIDRSSGPNQGYLYFVSNRNPNPGSTALDQGDIHLSVSSNGATSWSTAVIPTAAGKTQYFPMLDVDDNGFIHLAYYQNETGATNGGVLNASSANLYYTFSTDGGSIWSTPVQVNSGSNTLDYEDPPPDRSGASYYLIGDYQQIQAIGNASSGTVYVIWSGYDKDRSNASVGNSRPRVIGSAVSYSAVLCTAKPGDASANGILGLDDVVRTINYAFDKPGFPPCASSNKICWLSDLLCRGDWNGIGAVALNDAIWGVNYVFDKDNPGTACLGSSLINCWLPLPSGVCCVPVP